MEGICTAVGQKLRLTATDLNLATGTKLETRRIRSGLNPIETRLLRPTPTTRPLTLKVDSMFALMPRLLTSSAILATIGLTILCPQPTYAQELPDRPPTIELLPETTVAFVRIESFRELMEKWQDGVGGQFIRDENVAPLVERIGEEIQKNYSELAEEEVGLTLEELQSLPAGEISIAVIAPRRQELAYMVIAGLDDENEITDKALERFRVVNEENGLSVDNQISDRGIEYQTSMIEDKTMWYARVDGLLVGCTNKEELDAFFTRWAGEEVEKVRPLSENRKYVTIMNRCQHTDDLPAEVQFYADPIGIFKGAAMGNAGMQGMVAFLPILGLDGLLAVGGTSVLTDEKYEAINHMHLLLSSTRTGIIDMLALKPSYYQIEPWVPADCHFYSTNSWDVDQMYRELEEIFTQFGGGAIFQTSVLDKVKANTGLDLKEDLLVHLTGRFTFAQRNVEPVTLNSSSTIVCLELNDNVAALETLDKMLDKFREDNEDFDRDVSVEKHRDYQFWTMSDAMIERQKNRRVKAAERRAKRRGQDTPAARMEIRIPEPSIAVIDNWFIFTDSRDTMETIIDTLSGSIDAMADDPEWLEMSSEMTKLLGTDMPCAVAWTQPKYQLETWFNLANSDDTRTYLDKSVANAEKGASGAMRSLQAVMSDDVMPDYDSIKKYLLPSGWFVTSDDTGYHMLMFQKRYQGEEAR